MPKSSVERKAVVAARKRARRAAMSPEQRNDFRAAQRAYQRARRAAMTPEQLKMESAKKTRSGIKKTPEERKAAKAAKIAAMTPEELDAFKAANRAYDKARKAAWTPEQRKAANAARSAAKRAAKAKNIFYRPEEQTKPAMTPEQIKAAKNAARAAAYRARRAAKTPEQRKAMNAARSAAERAKKAAMKSERGDLQNKIENQHEETICENSKEGSKELDAMPEEKQNKFSPDFSRREKQLEEATRKLENKSSIEKTKAFVSFASSCVTRVVTTNPDRFQTAGIFIKNCLLEILSLHDEVACLKKQLQQTLTSAVESAVKLQRSANLKAAGSSCCRDKCKLSNSFSMKLELQSSTFVEIPYLLETENTNTYENRNDPLFIQPQGKKFDRTTLPPSYESIDLHNQNDKIFEVFAHDIAGDKKSENRDTNKKLKCSICSKKFGTSLGLTIHRKEHVNDSNEFNCCICSEVFQKYNLMTTHYLQAHSCNNIDIKLDNEEIDDEFERGAYELDFLISRNCLICFKKFEKFKVGLTTFRNHIIDLHSENKEFLKHFTFICSRCDKPHSVIRSLESHWKTICFAKWKNEYKCNEEIVCEFCGSRLSNEKSLSSHVKIFHMGKKLVCELCGKQFKRERTLSTHISTIHALDNKFVCEYCSKKFKTAGCLSKHTKSVHLGEKSFVCKFCSKRFATRINMDCHENTHTGKKPYECKFCNKSFAARSSLFIHEGKHEGYRCKKCDDSFGSYVELCTHNKFNHPGDHSSSAGLKVGSDDGVSLSHQPLPTSCDICEKSFKTYPSLKLHKRYSHGEAKYNCEICGKIFRNPVSFKDHKLSHENIKRFGCSLCSKQFRQGAGFYQHRRIIHANENAKIVKLNSETKIDG